MKKIILVVIGLLPFPVGYFMNYLIMSDTFFNKALPYGTIGLVFLLCWFLLGKVLSPLADTIKKASILAHSVALLVLILNLFQVIILKQYWANHVGVATQFYFLPLLNISFTLTPMFHSLSVVYIVSFSLMCVSFYLGCRTSRHFSK